MLLKGCEYVQEGIWSFWMRKGIRTDGHMFVFGMRVLDPAVIEREHAVEGFGKDEELQAYPDGDYDC